jgi:hypothetical protein
MASGEVAMASIASPKVALRHQHVTDLDVGRRQVVLCLQIAAIGGHKAFGDGTAVA